MKINRKIKAILSGLFALLVCLGYSGQSVADTISILGTGKVGSALGIQFAELGHTIIYGSRDPSARSVQQLVAKTQGAASATTNMESAQQGDIIVLAVPWQAVEKLVKNLGDLSGKIIIDPTNPLGKNNEGGYQHNVDTSIGEMLQRWLPNTHVVKAFNTLSYETMADPASAGGPVSIPIAGNNAAAKATVANLVEGVGFEAIDAGSIQYAHEIEGMLVLWINSRASGNSFDYHLRRAD